MFYQNPHKSSILSEKFYYILNHGKNKTSIDPIKKGGGPI